MYTWNPSAAYLYSVCSLNISVKFVILEKAQRLTSPELTLKAVLWKNKRLEADAN